MLAGFCCLTIKMEQKVLSKKATRFFTLQPPPRGHIFIFSKVVTVLFYSPLQKGIKSIQMVIKSKHLSNLLPLRNSTKDWNLWGVYLYTLVVTIFAKWQLLRFLEHDICLLINSSLIELRSSSDYSFSDRENILANCQFWQTRNGIWHRKVDTGGCGFTQASNKMVVKLQFSFNRTSITARCD